MRTGLAISAIAHTALLALGLVSLGFAEPLQPAPVESIAVDLVPLSALSNVRLGSLQSDIVETPTPAVVQDDQPAEIVEPTGNTEENQARPEDNPEPSLLPTENTAPEAQPEPEPEPEPEARPVQPEVTPVEPATRPVVEAEPEPAAEAEPEPRPEPEPEPEAVAPDPELATPVDPVTPAEVAPQPMARLASLEEKRARFAESEKARKAAEKKKKEEEIRLAELEEAERLAVEEASQQRQQEAPADVFADISSIIDNNDPTGADTGEGGEPTLGKETGTAATLSQSELDGFVSAVKVCMSTSPAAVDAGVTADLLIALDPNGNVSDVQLISQPVTPLEVSYAREAMNAVRNCAPYSMLSPETYQNWAQIGIKFDPSVL